MIFYLFCPYSAIIKANCPSTLSYKNASLWVYVRECACVSLPAQLFICAAAVGIFERSRVSVCVCVFFFLVQYFRLEVLAVFSAHRLLCQAKNAIFSPVPLRGRQKYLQFGSLRLPLPPLFPSPVPVPLLPLGHNSKSQPTAAPHARTVKKRKP